MWVVAAALAAFGGGCAVDQDKEMAPYREALGITKPADAAEDGKPATLEQVLEWTNHNYEPLQIEGETYIQSVIERQRAIANFLPTLTLAPEYSHRAGQVGGSNNRAADQTQVTAGLEQNIFNGFSDVARLYADAATIDERRAILLTLQANVLLDAAGAFYDVLRLEHTVDVLVNTASVQDARVKDIQSRLNNGLARPLDVSQAEAQSAGTRVKLVAARQALSNARTALGLFTAAPMASRPLTDSFDPPADAPGAASMQTLAIRERQELVAADAALRAARHEVDAAFGQYYPSVTLNLEYVLTVENAMTEQGWNTVLRANLPIFSAGRIEADVREAWSKVRQAFLNSVLTRRTVFSEVESARTDFAAAGEQIRELRQRLSTAELALKQAEASYDAGLATNLERLTAQDDLLNTRLDLVSQEYVRKVAYLSLLRATGRLRSELNIGAAH